MPYCSGPMAFLVDIFKKWSMVRPLSGVCVCVRVRACVSAGCVCNMELSDASLGQLADNSPPPRLTIGQLAACGAFAGLVNCVVINPVELIKARLQVESSCALFPST